MTSELSFLIELLLKHKLPPATKILIAERIKDVEENLNSRAPSVSALVRPMVIGGAMQAASTVAAMERHALSGDAAVPNPMPLNEAPVPVTAIAQTPAAAAALNTRAIAMSGKTTHNPLTGRPRKF